jgi:hypothetical protein
MGSQQSKEETNKVEETKDEEKEGEASNAAEVEGQQEEEEEEEDSSSPAEAESSGAEAEEDSSPSREGLRREQTTAMAVLAAITDDDDGEDAANATRHGSSSDEEAQSEERTVKLYKSSRLKGYITLALASYINYNAAEKSGDVLLGLTAVPSTDGQRGYAMSVSMISLVLSGFSVVAHLDRLTPLRGLWVAAYRSGAKCEMVLAVFLVLWWSVATGVETAVNGIAGDGKGQYNLYYSTWACCLTSYWILERWWVAMGWVRVVDFRNTSLLVFFWELVCEAWLTELCALSLSLSLN